MEILGIDVGGTGIKGAIIDIDTGILITKKHRVRTPQPATSDSIVTVIHDIAKKFSWSGTIGCGFPSVIQHNIVRTASNIDKKWIGLNAGELIMQKTGCPTYLFNDVDAAGYAEMKFGAGKGNMGSVIVLAAGTGIGSAIFTKGILYPNSELGFIKVKGMPGEHYAANSVREKEDLSWEEWAKRFNSYLTRIEKLFYPDLIILGGGVSKKFELYKSYFDINTPIVPAKLKNDAGMIGAAVAANYSHKL